MINSGFKHYFKDSFKAGLGITYVLPTFIRRLIEINRKLEKFEDEQRENARGKPALEQIAQETGFSDRALGFRNRLGYAMGFQAGGALSIMSALSIAELSNHYSSYAPAITLFGLTNAVSAVKEYQRFRSRRKLAAQAAR